LKENIFPTIHCSPFFFADPLVTELKIGCYIAWGLVVACFILFHLTVANGDEKNGW
jgi:hypothetical protein